ncbi:Glutamyl-Q tRNA(Asp) synthetase [bioreactor metagenome]|uniref:Glutamyl-Q tRNA(Asp) synthetase n=1 Tax=bioreactor metagenome TaxID=1076179 RepID=A0A645CU23_9ZZZZ
MRVRGGDITVEVVDELAGRCSGTVDDFVLRRNDGAYAYNLAVVVDDLAQGVDQVVRGDDLLASSPRQAWLTERLGGRVPTYAHVPLVVNRQGRRLAKRDGAVTLADLAAHGTPAAAVRSRLAVSLGLAEPGEPVTPADLLARFDPATLPRTPWVWDADGRRPSAERPEHPAVERPEPPAGSVGRPGDPADPVGPGNSPSGPEAQ